MAGLLKSHPIALTIAAVSAVATAAQIWLAESPLRVPESVGGFPAWLLTALLALIAGWVAIGLRFRRSPANAELRRRGRAGDAGGLQLSEAEFFEARHLGLLGAPATVKFGADRANPLPPELEAILVRRQLVRRLVLAERLVLAFPGDPDRRFDVSDSHLKLGQLAQAVGDRVEARRQYQASCAIAEELAALHPGRVAWQHQLMMSYSGLGDQAMATGDRAEAQRCFEAALAAAERIAAAQPADSAWQLCSLLCRNALCGIAIGQGDLEQARHQLETGFPLAQALLSRDPADAVAQRELFMCHAHHGQLADAEGDRAEAARHFTEAESVISALLLSRPDNRGFATDLTRLRAEMKRIGMR